MKLDKIDILLACTAGLLLPVGFIGLAPIGILLYRLGNRMEKEEKFDIEQIEKEFRAQMKNSTKSYNMKDYASKTLEGLR